MGRIAERAPRVLHLPLNADGVPWTNVQALRARGVHAELAVIERGAAHPETDWVIDLMPDPIRRGASQLHAFLRFLPGFDVFHFYGRTLLPKRVQFGALRLARRRSVVHVLGAHVLGAAPGELAWTAAADARVADSHHTARSLRDAEVIPSGIELSGIAPVPPREAERPLVVLAPAAGDATAAALAAACETLGAEPEVLDDVHHDRTFERCRAADVVVDDLDGGWYGTVAIEAMALGKPVVAFLDEDARRDAERELGVEVPVVSATRETLIDALRPLVAGAPERRRVGAAGRAFVERVHDASAVADRLLDVYARL